MSIGNLKDYGNKGNNFPWQLKMLQGLSLNQLKNTEEVLFEAVTSTLLVAAINAYFIANPTEYLISKVVIYNSTTTSFSAFVTIASL